MTDTPKPALTAEEWRQWHDGGIVGLAIPARVGVVGNERMHIDTTPISAPGEYHAIAALTLHGQPFGFTREDALVVRMAAAIVNSNGGDSTKHIYPKVLTVADRIEALLPPADV